MASQQQQGSPSRPGTAKAKPAGLGNLLNNDDQSSGPGAGIPHLRDSGFYSTNDTASKHTSAASIGTNGLSPSTSGYHSSPADKTPSPIASSMSTHNIVSPPQSHMSVASIVSPAVQPSDPRRYERPTSLEAAGHSGSTFGDNLTPGPGSRRESVDSRMNQGFGDMRLGPNSPYASNNQSTASIQNTLHAQRNPRPGMEGLAVNRISNGYQPSADRNPDAKTVRTAPAITGPATSHIARAAEPTKGQAWAFPEEEIQRVGSSHYDDSRRSSISESIASSQYTAESRLPPGQRRLDDGGVDYARMSNASAEFPQVHHHSMQHKQLNDLPVDEANGMTSAQPYSRTPELRVSHKLAERKRRTEMKDLFDQLRDLMPQERGSKASKWEILTKAIAEHHRLANHIHNLEVQLHSAGQEVEMLRERDRAMHAQGAPYEGDVPPPPARGPPPMPHNHALPPQGPPSGQSHAQGPPPSHQAPYAAPYANAGRPELPPIRSLGPSGAPGPESMTGVQYDDPRTNGRYEDPRPNGYRPEHY